MHSYLLFTFIPPRLALFQFCFRNCFLLFFILTLLGCTEQHKNAPLAERGILDLSTWDLKIDGSINLNGDWEFYWQKLLMPKDFSLGASTLPVKFANIPGSWNNTIVDGNTLLGDGYATYRLTVKTPQTQLVKAIRIKNQSSAYVLYINGKEIARNGVVGSSKNSVVPQYRLQQNSFYDNNPTLEIILHVANFNHRKGGVWNPIQLGHADTLRAAQSLQWIFDLTLFGCLFIMGSYYLSLYILYRKDRSPLYLAIFTLFIAIRILVTGNYYITQIFPNIPWEPAYKVELLTIILGPLGLLLFITSIFKSRQKDLFRLFLIVIMATLTVITIATPAKISSQTVIPCQMAILLLFGYCLYILIRESLQRDRNAGILLFGMTVLTATVLIDILSANKIIYLSYLTHLGIIFLIFSQSLVLSLRSSNAFRDVRNLSKELQEKNITLQRIDRLKDEFLANTTHELRTPLNGMVGMAESLVTDLSNKLSKNAIQSLQTIIGSGKRLAKLINDVLDFARLKNSDIQLNFKTIDLYSLTNVVISVLRPLAESKSLELVNAVNKSTPLAIGDEDRLQQILYNLGGNAIKFTDKGSVKISADVNDNFVEITVEDTGIGISPDRLGDIFTPYEQDDQIHQKGYGGTGLGLAIVKNLVTLHGGAITATSTVARGSKFIFSIPLSADNFRQAERESTDFISPIDVKPFDITQYGDIYKRKTDYDSDTILVVDDDPINVQVVINHLNSASFKTAAVADGLKALSLIEKSGPPALLLLDIMMPGIDGYAVCQKLRQKYSPPELPIILLTARSDLDNLVRGFAMGANDYITKPFSKDELLARAQTQLDLKRSYQILQENLLLKKEVERRERTELNLKLMQQRLSRILDSLEGAIIAVNECHEISFSNSQCDQLLGFSSGQLLGKPVIELFSSADRQKAATLFEEMILHPSQTLSQHHRNYELLHNQGQPLQCKLFFALLEIENERLLVLVLKSMHTGFETDTIDQPTLWNFIEELNTTRSTIQTIENTLNMTDAFGSDIKIQEGVRKLKTTLNQMENTLTNPMNDAQRRQLAVEAMNLALKYWKDETGNTKSDLAEQSGIWTVYINHNGFERTQTLDKYLDINHLPKQPRWQSIVETLDFVLLTCNTPSPLREKLEERSLQLKLSN